jgi:disulfide bond formation protein DsbB
MRREALYVILACAVLVLALVPVGTAVFVLGFVHGDSPCVLCWAQRTGMVLISLVGVFVLRYGPRPRYLGLGVIIGAAGIYMGLRHSALHIVRDVGQGFSVEILGAHTYVWSMFIYWICVVAMGALLMLLRDGEATTTPRQLRPLDRLAMSVFLVVVAGNVVQAFASTGPPPYMGQSDPVRFSFTPRHWVWSTEEWSPAPISLRGRWTIEKPSVDALVTDPRQGPLEGLSSLETTRRMALTLPVNGPITDLAYDAGTDRFLLTTRNGVYLADAALGHVARSAIVDTLFSVDLGEFAGTAFLDGRTVMALGQNKSYVTLRESGRADADRNFRFFLDGFDAFEELARSRLSTMRARMLYTMSLAYDDATKSIYTVTVPNSRVKRMVVSRFDRSDMLLSEEFMPGLGGGSGLALGGEGRAIDEYYVTGAAIADGKLYAISAAYSTLLTIDLPSRAIVAAHAVAGLDRPTGLALRGDELYIVNARGAVAVVDRPR